MSSVRSIACCVVATAILAAAGVGKSAHSAERQTEASSVPQNGHVWPLKLAAFANSGKRLVTEDNNGLIIWDAATGEQIQNIGPLAGRGQVSPDGVTLLYVVEDGEIHHLCLHEIGQPQPRLRIKLPQGCDTAVWFSNDGKHVLARDSSSAKLLVWNTQTGQTVSAQKLPAYNSPRLAELEKQLRDRPRDQIPEGAEYVFQLLLSLETAGPDGSRLAIAGKSPLGFGDGYFSPDGKRFVSVNWHDTGSDLEDVSVWDAPASKLLHFFEGRYGLPQHVLFHPDGKQYLVGNGFKSATLHAAATGEAIRTFGELQATITALAMSESGKLICAGTAQGELVVWDAATGERKASVISKEPVLAIVCDGDERVLVASDMVRSHSLPELDDVREFSQPARSMLLEPEGRRLLLKNFPTVTVGRGTVTLHEVDNGHKLKSVMRSPDTEMLLSPNGKWALGIPRREQFNQRFRNVEIPLWRIATGERLHTFPAGSHKFDFHFPPSEAVKREISITLPKSSAGVGAIRSRYRYRHHVPEFGFRQNAWDREDEITELAPAGLAWLKSLKERDSLLPLEGPQLMYERADNLSPTVWNTGWSGRIVGQYKRSKLLHRYTIPGMVPTAATLTSDRSQLILAYREEERTGSARAIVVCGTKDGSMLKRIDATQKEMATSWAIDSLALSPDDRFLAVGYDYHNYILDRKTDDLTFVGKAQGGLPARKIALFSPDSRWAILFGIKRTLWDLTGKKAVLDLGEYNDAYHMTFSPNGKTLYVNGYDGPRLIRSATGEVVQRFPSHSLEIRFNKDGTRMIPLQNGIDEVSLWDFQEAAPICRLTEGSSRNLIDAVFTPDGDRVVCLETTDGTSTLSVRDAATGKVQAKHSRTTSPFGYRSNHPAPIFDDKDHLLTVQPRSVTVWHLPTARPVHHFTAPGRSNCLVVQEGDTVLVVAPGERATLWNIQTGEQLREFLEMPSDLSHPNPVWFSEDGAKLFARHRKGQSLTVWDADRGVVTARHHLIDEGQKWFTYVD